MTKHNEPWIIQRLDRSVDVTIFPLLRGGARGRGQSKIPKTCETGQSIVEGEARDRLCLKEETSDK